MIFSDRYVRMKGARKSNATAAATSSVAAMNATVTILLGSGLEQTAPSAQVVRRARQISQ